MRNYKSKVRLAIVALSAIICLSFLIADSNDAAAYTDGAWQYVVDDNGDAVITHWDPMAPGNGLAGDVLTIPGTLKAPDDTVTRTVVSLRGSQTSGIMPPNVPVKEVILPPTVETLGTNAFYRCFSLETINMSNVVELQYRAFFLCTALETIDISNVTVIGNEAFCGCTSLEDVTMPANFDGVGISAFEGCTSLVSIDLSGMKDGGSIGRYMYTLYDRTYYSSSAFKGCTSLEEVILPVSTSYLICDDSFAGCTSLEEIDISNATFVGSGAFYGCTSLSKIEMPDNVYTGVILRGTFENCISLTEIDLKKLAPLSAITSNGMERGPTYTTANHTHPFAGSGVEKIYATGSGDFMSIGGVLFTIDGKTLVCYPGAGPASYSVPSGTETIGPYAFGYLPVKDIDLGSVTTVREGAFAVSGLETITAPNLVSIGESAFRNCASLSDLYLPALASVGDTAFEMCSGILNMTVPSLTSVGNSSFKDCSSLLTLDVPKLTDRGNAFYGCTSITDVYATGSLIYESIGGILYNKSVTEIVWFPSAKGGHVDLPASVVSIGERTFSESKIASINMSGIENIGDYAFYKCNQLTDVDTSNMFSVGSYSFYQCASLENIDFSMMNTINDYAFYECTKLQTMDMTAVEYIGNNAFAGCTSLTRVMAPNLVRIGDGAFMNCGSILMADLPSLEIMEVNATGGAGGRAFSNCNRLTYVSIPNVESVAPSSFDNCKSLTNVILPSKEYTIQTNAFAGCSSLETIDLTYATSVAGFANCISLKYISAPNAVAVSGFDNCKNLAYVYLPSVIAIPDFSFRYCAIEVFYAPMMEFPYLQSFESGGTYAHQLRSIFGDATVNRLIVASVQGTIVNTGAVSTPVFGSIYITSDYKNGLISSDLPSKTNVYRSPDANGWSSEYGTYHTIEYVMDGKTVFMDAVADGGKAREIFILDEGKAWMLDGEEYIFSKVVSSDLTLTEGRLTEYTEDAAAESGYDMVRILVAVASLVAIGVVVAVYMMRRPA